MYKKNFESLGLFFWVEAQRNVLPTITLTQAIDRYYRFINEPYDINVAIVTVSRMRSEYIDMNYDKRVTSNSGCPKFSKKVSIS